MILADSSVWIEYLRGRLPQLGESLSRAEILAHPWITSELALGNMRDRVVRLNAMDHLEEALVASVDEIRRLIERHQLSGRGIGLVDAQVIASARLTRCSLWTLDRRLSDAARMVGIDVIGPT